MRLSAYWDAIIGRREPAPKLPSGCCVYAIGDVHGRRDLLETLLDRIRDDAGQVQNYLVMLGDYVDRGPDSKGVIDLLVTLEMPGLELVALRGNHDQLVLDFLTDPKIYLTWRSFGGAETLLSYGVEPPAPSDPQDLERARRALAARLPAEHVTFLEGLTNSYTIGDYFFVHAGIRPTCSLDQQKAEDLLWIRDEFLASNKRYEKVIVHGHSPSDVPVRRRNRIGVDTGAYATNILTAVKLWDDHCEFLSSGG
jgi:Predicted phosphohydrolases